MMEDARCEMNVAVSFGLVQYDSARLQSVSAAGKRLRASFVSMNRSRFVSAGSVVTSLTTESSDARKATGRSPATERSEGCENLRFSRSRKRNAFSRTPQATGQSPVTERRYAPQAARNNRSSGNRPTAGDSRTQSDDITERSSVSSQKPEASGDSRENGDPTIEVTQKIEGTNGPERNERACTDVDPHRSRAASASVSRSSGDSWVVRLRSLAISNHSSRLTSPIRAA